MSNTRADYRRYARFLVKASRRETRAARRREFFTKLGATARLPLRGARLAQVQAR